MIKKIINQNNLQNSIYYNIPISLSTRRAHSIAKNFLYEAHFEMIIYEFSLSINYSFLEPGDLLKIKIQEESTSNDFIEEYIVNEVIQYKDFIKIYAYRYLPDIYNLHSFSILLQKFKKNKQESFLNQINKNSKTFLSLIQIPNIDKKNYNKDGAIGFLISLLEKELNWKGANIFKFENNLNEFVFETKEISIFGKLIDSSKLSSSINSTMIDYESEFIISLQFPEKQILTSISDNEFFACKNLAKIGNEIVNFKEVILLKNGVYKVKILMRGLFGTENFIKDHKNNEVFCMIDKNLKLNDAENINQNMQYNVVTYGDSINLISNAKIFMENFYSLQHQVCNLKISPIENKKFNFELSFQKRLRISNSMLNYFEEDFENSKNVLRLNQSGKIEIFETRTGEAYLIKIFENESKNNLLLEKIIEERFFQFDLQNFFSQIYIEIGKLNERYPQYYFIGVRADLIKCEILEIKHLLYS